MLPCYPSQRLLLKQLILYMQTRFIQDAKLIRCTVPLLCIATPTHMLSPCIVHTLIIFILVYARVIEKPNYTCMHVFLLFFKFMYFVIQMHVVCETRIPEHTQQREAKSQHCTKRRLSKCIMDSISEL